MYSYWAKNRLINYLKLPDSAKLRVPVKWARALLTNVISSRTDVPKTQTKLFLVYEVQPIWLEPSYYLAW